MEYFKFYCSYTEALEGLSGDDYKTLIQAIARYAATGEEPQLQDPLHMFFNFMKIGIDDSRTHQENGRKGGRPRKHQPEDAEKQKTPENPPFNPLKTPLKANENPQKPPFSNEPESPAEDPSLARARTRINNNIYNTSSLNSNSITENNTKGLDNGGVKDREYEGKGTQQTRHRYGTYGNVLLSDQEMEKLRSEFPDWEEWIRRVDTYTQSSGKRYKDYLAVIRNWARRDSEQRTRSGPLNNFTETGSTDLDRVLEEHRQRMIDRVASITGGAT